MEMVSATPVYVTINTIYRHTRMDFFVSFSRFIIFIIEGFRFGLNLYICVGVVPIISMVGSIAATATAAAAAAARIPAAGRTSSAAALALFMAVILSALL